MRVQQADLPSTALLSAYNDGIGYSDCYTTRLDQRVSFSEYVTAFYATPLFKAERFLLGLFLNRPSKDSDVIALANGDSETFAAWTVEARQQDQILLCDIASRTRSWLHIEPTSNNGTRLFFGSAVVPARENPDGSSDMGWMFRSLLGFHRLYSVALLRSAAKRLIKDMS